MSLLIILVFFGIALLGHAAGVLARPRRPSPACIVSDVDFNLLPTRMMNAVNAFPLMSIPFFILAGELMIKAGIMERLIDLANAVVGRVRGGLAHVTMLAGLGLSTVSGAAVADASALGSTLIPVAAQALRPRLLDRGGRRGRQPRADHPALGRDDRLRLHGRARRCRSAACSWPASFPGILLVASMMAMCSVHRASSATIPLTGEAVLLARASATSSSARCIIFMMPVVVIGGIVGGAFTATEGSAIAVVYALAIGFFVTRTLEAVRPARGDGAHRDHLGGGRRDDRLRLGRHLHADGRPAARQLLRC